MVGGVQFPLLHHWKLLSTTPSLTLVRRGYLVIACGGGGIPVVRDGQQLKGVEAVIDKDLASALLASQLGADLLVIPTGVEKVAINFGTPQQQWLDAISIAEAQTLLREGQFGVGSMQPKVEAIVDFINASQQQGKQASGLITSPQTIKAAPGASERYMDNPLILWRTQ